MYQALYRKYRPQTFDDVVGQQAVTQTLKTQLLTGRLSHAYLFTGTRGTGKTSCAKILAKAVNCLNPQDGNPCNVCEACRSIDSGSCMDVLEIDAASNNGVDNVRDLRDGAVYTPSQVKKRVYIIDEVHMLSTSAFNALLKIVEEPPEHLMFILATTELNKVPATILSRCQRFSFRRLTQEDIAGYLSKCAYNEGIELEHEAAKALALLADGGMRDGVSLLDQCASSCGGTVSLQQVYECLGLAGERIAAEMIGYVAKHDAKALLGKFQQLYAEGKDLAAMLDELTAMTRDLLILKAAPKSGISMLSGVSTDEEAMSLTQQFTTAELLRLTKILQETANGFRTSANRRIDAELCLISLCQPALRSEQKDILARLSRLEENLAAGVFQPNAQPEVVSAPPQRSAVDEPPAEEKEPEQSEEPIGFWPELVDKVRRELETQPKLKGFFSAGEQSPIRSMLKGDKLELVTTEFVQHEVDTPQVRQLIALKAQVILKRPVQVKFVSDKEAAAKTNENFQSLLEFGKQHQDMIKIKES